MKPYFILLSACLMLAGCAEQKAAAPEKKGNGYTDVDTDNIKLVKALNDASIKFDTAAMRSFYSSNTDSIHNNLEGMTVDQNLLMIADLQKQGISIEIESYAPIWETVNDSADPRGVRNFVIAYMIMNLKKGDKTKQMLFNQVCAIKDNKIVEEWDIYDTKVYYDLLQ